MLFCCYSHSHLYSNPTPIPVESHENPIPVETPIPMHTCTYVFLGTTDNHLPLQMVFLSCSSTFAKLLKSSIRRTFRLSGSVPMMFSSGTLTPLPIPTAISFVGMPPDITVFSLSDSLCNYETEAYNLIHDATYVQYAITRIPHPEKSKPIAFTRDAMHSADYAVGIFLSVCLSICHTPVFYRNG